MLLNVAVNLTGFPASDGLGLDVSVSKMVAGTTCCESTVDKLRLLAESPLYSAVMELAPSGNSVVASVATPPLNVPVPSFDAPFLKVTVPVGDPLEDTFAVKVTDSR